MSYPNGPPSPLKAWAESVSIEAYGLGVKEGSALRKAVNIGLQKSQAGLACLIPEIRRNIGRDLFLSLKQECNFHMSKCPCIGLKWLQSSCLFS